MRDDGGPAFPIAEQYSQITNTWVKDHPGMTMRDYFAAQAMRIIYVQSYSRDDLHPLFARECYALADAMIAERSKS